MLIDRINQDKITFMKSKEATKLTAVRLVISEIKNEEIKQKKQLTDEDAWVVIKRLANQLQESLSFAKDDKARTLEYSTQLEVVKSYLPRELTADEIEAIVKAIIADNGFNGKKNLGKVMQIIKPQIVGRADGKLVNQIVSKLLG